MEPVLCLAEEPGSGVNESLDRALRPGFCARWEVGEWNSSLLDRIVRYGTRLIIAVAVPWSPRSTNLFRWFCQRETNTPVLAVLPSAVDDETLGTVAQAADDFILSPIRSEELRLRLNRLLGAPREKNDEKESARAHLTELMGMGQLVGNHPSFLNVIKAIPLLAKSDHPVLITGPTGTGKELCARGIHLLGNRRSFPFIAVDCGAVPDHLFENELFGHSRGAFTDAHAEQKGLIAMAEGGTLFLDEIDALSMAAQAKLLRFLQERVYRPLGADRFVQARVRIIAATNRDIEACVREKRFRADLFFRLNALKMDLPGLAERHGDVELLARHFVKMEIPDQPNKKSISQAALRKLDSYHWPGNVRELLNVIRRTVLFAEGNIILASDVHLPVPDTPDDEPVDDFNHARIRAIEAFEKQYAEQLLRKHKGNVTRAAREAGKDRRAFGRLKKKYGIDL
jgi:DNA-binding NtrC family response regulator